MGEVAKHNGSACGRKSYREKPYYHVTNGALADFFARE
jgi:hypothetical protein